MCVEREGGMFLLYISVYIWHCVFCVMLNKLSAHTQEELLAFLYSEEPHGKVK